MLKSLENYIGREKVIKLLHDFGITGYSIYPRNDAKHEELRTKLYKALIRAKKMK